MFCHVFPSSCFTLDMLADKDYRHGARINTSPANNIPAASSSWAKDVRLTQKPNSKKKNLPQHLNIPAAHTRTHKWNPLVFIFKWKFLSFKLWLFPSLAFNACCKDWRVGEWREEWKEAERERDAERGIWVSPRHHHSPRLHNLSSQIFDKQTGRLADRHISPAAPLAPPMTAVKTAVRESLSLLCLF